MPQLHEYVYVCRGAGLLTSSSKSRSRAKKAASYLGGKSVPRGRVVKAPLRRDTSLYNISSTDHKTQVMKLTARATCQIMPVLRPRATNKAAIIKHHPRPVNYRK